MSQKIRRNRSEGLAHRARLRALVLPGLRVGQRLPKGLWLGSVLGICQAEAMRHLHRMLAEAGVRTETRQPGGCRGVFVVSLPEWRAAA